MLWGLKRADIRCAISRWDCIVHSSELLHIDLGKSDMYRVLHRETIVFRHVLIQERKSGNQYKCNKHIKHIPDNYDTQTYLQRTVYFHVFCSCFVFLANCKVSSLRMHWEYITWGALQDCIRFRSNHNIVGR